MRTSIFKLACAFGLILLFNLTAWSESLDGKDLALTKGAEGKTMAVGKEPFDRSKSAPQLHLNRSVNGVLSSNSERLPEDGSFVGRYLLHAAPGSPIVVDLHSDAFDAFLIIQDMSGRWIDYNDDFMSSLDSRVAFHMPASGSVWVLANTHSPGETGAFRLHAMPADDAELPGFPPSRQVGVGETVGGRFSSDSFLIWDDTYAAGYRVPSSISGRISLSMSSQDFRPFVQVLDVAGNLLFHGAAPGNGGTLDAQFSTTPGMPTFIMANQMTRSIGAYDMSLDYHQPAAMPSGMDPNGNYAFLVGMSYYPPGISDLPLVANDIIAMRRMLVEDLGYDENYIYVLENEDATRDAILDGISGFLGRAGTSGTATFYFSGHGTKTQENVALVEPIDIEEDGVDEALVAYDSLIIDDELGFSLRMLTAGHINAFLDTCHSGTGVRTDLAMPKFLKASDTHKMLPNQFITDEVDISAMLASGHDLSQLDPRIAFFASSRYDELSWIAGSVDMSLYTYFLTDMLPEFLNRSMGELEAAMQPLVVNWSRANLGATQTPNAEGRLHGVTIAELMGVQR